MKNKKNNKNKKTNVNKKRKDSSYHNNNDYDYLDLEGKSGKSCFIF